jgi:hypothetical protein
MPFCSHERRFHLLKSARVRLPQVSQVVVSGGVALLMAESGVVGASVCAGSPDLPHEEGLVMAIRAGHLRLRGNPTDEDVIPKWLLRAFHAQAGSIIVSVAEEYGTASGQDAEAFPDHA